MDIGKPNGLDANRSEAFQILEETVLSKKTTSLCEKHESVGLALKQPLSGSCSAREESILNSVFRCGQGEEGSRGSPSEGGAKDDREQWMREFLPGIGILCTLCPLVSQHCNSSVTCRPVAAVGLSLFPSPNGSVW